MSGPHRDWEMNTGIGYDGPYFSPGEHINPNDYAHPVDFHQQQALLEQLHGQFGARGAYAADPYMDTQQQDTEAWLTQINTASVVAHEDEAGAPVSTPPVDGYPINYGDRWQRDMASRGYIRDAVGSMVTRQAYRAAYEAYTAAHGLDTRRTETAPKEVRRPETLRSETLPTEAAPAETTSTASPPLHKLSRVNYASPEELRKYRQSKRAWVYQHVREEAALEGARREERSSVHDAEATEPSGNTPIRERIGREVAYLFARWFG